MLLLWKAVWRFLKKLKVGYMLIKMKKPTIGFRETMPGDIPKGP
jgi:hypothetical protein